MDPAELELDELSLEKLATDPVGRRNLEVLQGWAERPPAGRARRVHVRFMLRPVEVLGDAFVTGLRLERTQLDRTGLATGTGEMCTVEASMIVRSVGHRGMPIPGIPFDERNGVIPNVADRVQGPGAGAPGGVCRGLDQAWRDGCDRNQQARRE